MVTAKAGRQDPSTVAAHYDELDWVYRAVWGEHLHHGLWTDGAASSEEAADNLVGLVAEHLQLRPGAAAIDIGCGYGATSRRLARLTGAELTGVTVSAAQHRRAEAEEQPDPAPTYLHGDWLENELADDAFDGAFAIEVIAHIEDKQRAFDEAARTLAPGGRMVVCDWLTGPAPRAWQNRLLLEPICREARLPSMSSAAEYATMMERAGLHHVHTEDLTGRVRRTWSIARRRVARDVLAGGGLRRYLLTADAQERAMAFSLVRIPTAYRCGAMRYEVVVAEKPSAPGFSSTST